MKLLGAYKVTMLENKLGLTTSADLAREEERLTKKRALELFENNILDRIPVGTFQGLQEIHKHLFQDVYDFAGQLRIVNVAKGNFRFASVMYLERALEHISKMPQSTYDEIVDKYIEMNVAHPFREGNGRSTRIWLDQILKQELGQVIDWSRIDKDQYLSAMERSPINGLELKYLLKEALTEAVDDRQVYMKGLDASYYYEGYYTYKTDEL